MSVAKRAALIAIIFLTATCLLFFSFAQNQSAKDKLLDKKKKIESEIEYYKSLLNETKKSKELSVNQIVLLKNQIEKRELLIEDINGEIALLNVEIDANYKEIKRSNEQLNSMRTEYAGMIYHAYKNRNTYNRMMYIFASEDFNQAYRRLKYYQQYNEYLQRQVALINSTKKIIIQKNTELEKQKNSKKELLSASELEKQKLDKERAQKDTDLKKLKKKESDLRKKLKQKEKEAATLKKKIEAAIAEEIKKSASKSNKTVNENTTVKNVLTPEEKLVSDNFSSNKGKLPWPVERGAVTGSFGEHPHPVLDGILVKNNGVDISTASGTQARVVFNGTVSSIVTITNTNIAVIVRHGEFFTVYANLASVSVSKGSKVSTKQGIGTIYTSVEERKTELHFEIWQGRLICNPAEWLTSK
ncbi:MAG: peptidoglycan DD-metalloendopeptidase family protein [Bacteroidales bacterium]|jgi:septal ring factor EnvC (AmiA/AmiB activator)|nr:peptidoglycan DD-metalloendopeptidase family protein [Bacteroidales bacterium]MDD4214015.1 peptidoglycan DD-metalloendopeptidase family protein [Bacteroidales bacterium]